MNIVVLAGGTGSIALQTGLYHLLDKQFDGVDTKIIVNAYDNGLSTGSVRSVMGGKILGPSDVRKNQTTRLRLENPHSEWLKFLDIRFTCESTKAEQFCIDEINKLNIELRNNNITLKQDVLISAITEFFNVPVATKIDYNDFALANIIYAGLAAQNNNSLRKAAKVMANLMDIKDNVLLNDDTSLFLGAVTKLGKQITDEGDIVSWGNVDDPFVDVFFATSQGHNTFPVLCDESLDAITTADLIILSSGTLWSSLIPTYMSHNFTQAIINSKAQVLMIMNRLPDKDSPGQNAQEIIDILIPKMLPMNRIHVIADSTGSPQMNKLSDYSRIASFKTFDLKDVLDTRLHNPHKLAYAVGLTYFDRYLGSNYYMFDYDDTLVGRGNKWTKASQHNVEKIAWLNGMIKLGICTGNSIKAINLRGIPEGGEDFRQGPPIYKDIVVYADGGVNKYLYNTEPHISDDGIRNTLVECINKKVLIPDEGQFGINSIVEELQWAGIPRSKIENRNNAILAIKPIDAEYRGILYSLISYIIKGSDLVPHSTGRTTVEISHRELSKLDAVKHVLKVEKPTAITYVGDELHEGNDSAVKWHEKLKCLSVANPVQTAFFLQILFMSEQRNG